MATHTVLFRAAHHYSSHPCITRLAERMFVVDAATWQWTPASSAEDWDRHPLAYARADGGAYVHLSHDGGRTFTDTR